MLHVGIGSIGELKGIFCAVDNVVLVGGILLNIVFAERNLRVKAHLAVLVAVDNLDQTVLGNNTAVRCGNFFIGKECKRDICNLAVVADAEKIILFENLL